MTRVLFYVLVGLVLTACSGGTKKTTSLADYNRKPLQVTLKKRAASVDLTPEWLKIRRQRDKALTRVEQLEPAIYKALEHALRFKTQDRYSNSNPQIVDVQFQPKPYILPNFLRGNQEVHPWPHRVKMSFRFSTEHQGFLKKHVCTAYYLVHNTNLIEALNDMKRIKQGAQALYFRANFEIDSCSPSFHFRQSTPGGLRLSKTLTKEGYRTTLTHADKFLGHHNVVVGGHLLMQVDMPRNLLVDVYVFMHRDEIAKQSAAQFKERRKALSFKHQLKTDYKLDTPF